MNLVFIRHGRSTADAGCCIGSSDVALAADGLASIRTLAAAWHARGSCSVTGEPSRVVASDLRRAVDSAHIFGLLWNREVEIDPRLRELDFGEWEGQMWRTIETKDAKHFRIWSEAWTRVAPPGGETVSSLADRARSWLCSLPITEDDRSTIAVVSHAGWIRAAVAQVLCRPLERMFEIPADYAHATIVRVEARRGQLVAVNTSTIP